MFEKSKEKGEGARFPFGSLLHQSLLTPLCPGFPGTRRGKRGAVEWTGENWGLPAGQAPGASRKGASPRAPS